MNLYLALTDNRWFRFLRSRPELDEVSIFLLDQDDRTRGLPRRYEE